jgi:hypothetical protein
MVIMAKTALFLALVALVSAFLIGGRYAVTSPGQGGGVTRVVDRFTGKVVWVCVGDTCNEVAYKANSN